MPYNKSLKGTTRSKAGLKPTKGKPKLPPICGHGTPPQPPIKRTYFDTRTGKIVTRIEK